MPTPPASPTVHRELPEFVAAVERRARRSIAGAGLPADQGELLMSRFPEPTPARLVPHLMAPFYFLVRAHGAPAGEIVEAAGAAFMLVQRAVSVIDKVEDDDLAGAWARLGPAVTLNAGVTLLVLGVDALWALEQRTPAMRSVDLRGLLRRHLTRMSGGQHRELTARRALLSVEQRVEIAADKATELSLLTELAGACAGAQTDTLAAYRAIGRELAILVQIFNDLADLLGPGPSDDLRTGTWNIPLTALLEALPELERARWIRGLVDGERDDGEAIVRALYERGVVRSLAERVEAGRLRIHAGLKGLACGGPYLALFVAWVDDLTGMLYRPPASPLWDDVAAGERASLSPFDLEIYERFSRARSA